MAKLIANDEQETIHQGKQWNNLDYLTKHVLQEPSEKNGEWCYLMPAGVESPK